MEKKTIGKFISALRRANGMTQKELGEKLFVSDKTVSRWECDECTPELSLIPSIAEIFGITTDELLRGERNNPDREAATEDVASKQKAKSDKQFKLMLLDEPTSGLDPVVRDEVVDMFYDFTRDENHSILISSHIVSDLEKLCDYVAFLHKGKLLLCEEKDVLLSEYGIIHCTVEQLSELNNEVIRNRKETPYGAEAIVLRKDAPDGFKLSPISIEELFVFMVKEAK